MSIHPTHLGLVITVIMAFHGAGALAQTSCGDAQIQRGYELRLEGHHGMALVQFQQAWEACRSPRALGQMALAEAALGLWIDADRHLTEALAAASDPWVLRSRAQLDDAQNQVAAHVGLLEVRGGVPGAEVLLDDRPVATLPMRGPLRTVAGEAQLTVRAAGYRTVTRTVVITAGPPVPVTIELARMPTPVTVEAHVETASAATRPAYPTLPHRMLPLPTAGSTQRTLGWVAAAGTGGALAGGLVAQLVHAGQAGDFNTHCLVNGGVALERAGSNRGDCQSLYVEGSTMQSVSIGSFVAGGALAVTSTVLLLTAPRRRELSTSAFACGQGPGTFGVACVASF